MKDSVRMQMILFRNANEGASHGSSFTYRELARQSNHFFLPVTVCCCSRDFRRQLTAVSVIISLWIYSEAINY